MESQSILIKNASILNPIGNGKTESKNSDLLIIDDKIAEIKRGIDESSAEKVIDATDKILMPGFVNTHTHISMSLLRGIADDLELDTWLNDHIWPMEAHLCEEYCYIGALLGAAEMIKSGTTTFSDMYFYMDGVARAVDEIGMRAVLSYGMIDFGIEEKRENEFKENIALIKNHNNTAEGRITTRFGPHSCYTASVDLLERVRKEADKYNVGIHIHMNETMKEINDIGEAHDNKRPFELLDSIDFLGDDVVAAHCVWLDENEMNLIKNNDVKVSHNPCSNMKLASGAAPVGELLERGICVGLGTDGASSNNNLDMFDEMKFAALLGKVSTLNPKVLNADEVINMATFNGARSLNIDAGAIEVGKKADIILVDTNAPNMTPMSNSLSSNLVYSANGSNVDTTICNGRILMEGRKLVSVDEEFILSEAKRAIGEMKELREADSDD
ncbi:MAG: amidohydrolase family protein [Methanobrevibacter sp.]|nr:amidohydrolase family protein [Methanobrevibacter sp.]